MSQVTDQKPDFPLPKAEGEIKYATLENFEDLRNQLERQGKILDWTYGFIIAVLVVCVIAFITFILDAWRFHFEAYSTYTQTIESLKKNENQQPVKDGSITQTQSFQPQVIIEAATSTSILIR